MWIEKGGQSWQKVKWGMLRFLKVLLQKEMGCKRKLKHTGWLAFISLKANVSSLALTFVSSKHCFCSEWRHMSLEQKFKLAKMEILPRWPSDSEVYLFFIDGMHSWKKNQKTNPVLFNIINSTTSIKAIQPHKTVCIHTKLSKIGQAFTRSPPSLQIQSYHTTCA